jgi:hypothetical protein
MTNPMFPHADLAAMRKRARQRASDLAQAGRRNAACAVRDLGLGEALADPAVAYGVMLIVRDRLANANFVTAVAERGRMWIGAALPDAGAALMSEDAAEANGSGPAEPTPLAGSDPTDQAAGVSPSDGNATPEGGDTQVTPNTGDHKSVEVAAPLFDEPSGAASAGDGEGAARFIQTPKEIEPLRADDHTPAPVTAAAAPDHRNVVRGVTAEQFVTAQIGEHSPPQTAPPRTSLAASVTPGLARPNRPGALPAAPLATTPRRPGAPTAFRPFPTDEPSDRERTS